MRVVIQRVKHASVTVDGEPIAAIGSGLLILLGVGSADTDETARLLAAKIAALRIFEDDQGKMNLSVRDTGGEAIVVSQFTLYADTRKGHRPSFTDAAAPDLARPLCDRFADNLRQEWVPTQTGEFGAYMQVELLNDGPVTIEMEM
jgi:D-tyrosyl-tRNA(Tyr) deacylase